MLIKALRSHAISEDRVRWAVKTFRQSKQCAKALGITVQAFNRLCRKYDIVRKGRDSDDD